jgi:hypothetical protein
VLGYDQIGKRPEIFPKWINSQISLQYIVLWDKIKVIIIINWTLLHEGEVGSSGIAPPTMEVDSPHSDRKLGIYKL